MIDDILKEMRDIGLFGLTIPPEYGGLGLTMEEEVLTSIEMCRASPAFRSIAGTNNGIGSQGIVIDGTEEQKQNYLPRLATGELIGSFALTEPGAGSDAGSLTTSARRDGDLLLQTLFAIGAEAEHHSELPRSSDHHIFVRVRRG